MAREVNACEQSANSLALMLMGLDSQLDQKLQDFRRLLKSQADDPTLSTALSAAEAIYDDLELDMQSNINRYGESFRRLLHGSTEERRETLIAPLLKKDAIINDLIRLAEPISVEIDKILLHPTDNDENSENLDKVRERLSSRFLSLIEALAQLGDQDGVLNELSKSLSPPPDWTTLDKLASRIILLLEERVTKEKEQFEDYLAELNLKLKRINDIVADDSKTLSEIKQINLDFNSSISQQMSEARDKIDRHSELNLLKNDLLESLDAITTRLESYQSSYAGKLSNLNTSKVLMNEHIQALEKENVSLLSALQKERQLSQHDPLTQLPNRLGFEQRLKEELARAKRHDQPISIAVLDIDFFKKINDQFGHLVGDKVLKMMSKEMKKVSRGSDYLARFGGEEFILLLPQTALDEAFSAVDKIRQRIESRPFHFQNKPVPITISAGVAQLQNDEGTDHWINRADSALYISKQEGRNKVSSAA